MKAEHLERKVIYRSPWVNLYVDRVRLPGGHLIETQHLLDFERPSVVAYVQDEGGRILFVEVYRYTAGSTSWELPAGGVEPDETALEAAGREVLEESGYATRAPELVYTYHPLNGIGNKVVHVVRCQAAEKAGEFDKNEVSNIKWFSLEEIEQMLVQGELTDGLSLVALFLCGCILMARGHNG